MIYTNEGLVAHAKKALALNTKYMWGGILRLITPQYIEQLRSMYGTLQGTGYTASRYKELYSLCGKDYYGVDCVGLIKSYYWSGNTNGGTGSPKYGAAGYPDVNANMMFNRAKVKGKIDTLPERKGIIVISRKNGNHVGIYIGDGYTIESTLGKRGDGVVKHKLDKTFWDNWFECPYIEYRKDVKEQLKTVTLAFDAAVRSAPTQKSSKLGVLKAGKKCVIAQGTETKDPITGYIYIRLGGEQSQWIVKSAIKP